MNVSSQDYKQHPKPDQSAKCIKRNKNRFAQMCFHLIINTLNKYKACLLTLYKYPSNIHYKTHSLWNRMKVKFDLRIFCGRKYAYTPSGNCMIAQRNI